MTDERGLRSGVDQITETVIAFSGGVINIVLEREKERVGSGTGFFVPGYLVTASHVLRAANFDTVVLHLSGSSGNDDVRLAADTVLASIRHESPEADHDFALLEIDQPEFESLPRFALGSTANVSPGRLPVPMEAWRGADPAKGEHFGLGAGWLEANVWSVFFDPLFVP